MGHGADRETVSSGRAASRQGGFTLLELMVVVFLLTLVTGVVSVGLTRSMPSARVKEASRELAATLRHAKVLAQLRGQDMIVDFFPEENRYRLRGEGETILAEGIRMVVVDPVEGDLTEGTWQTVFFAEGGARGAAVELRQGGESILVSIDPIMGARIR